MNNATKSPESFMMSSNAEDRAPELEALHDTDSQFQIEASYRTYLLLDGLQTYSEKTPVRTGKYAKRMKTLTKAYTFGDEDPITVQRFLVQFKRACSMNGLPEGKASRIMTALLKDEPASSLTVEMTLYEHKEISSRLPKAGESRFLCTWRL